MLAVVLAYSSSEEMMSEGGHCLPTMSSGSTSNSDSSEPPGEVSWKGSCMNPDLCTKVNDRKSCPDLENPEMVARPFCKSTLASFFLDHDSEDIFHGFFIPTGQSSGSTGNRNLAGGVSIAACTNWTVRK